MDLTVLALVCLFKPPKQLRLSYGTSGLSTMHNVQFVKYDVTVSFMAQVLDTVTYLVPQVLDTAS